MSTDTSDLAVPELGQIVTIRQRRYIATDINISQLPSTGSDFPLQTPQHLIILESIEDDALGEKLQVVWELEPGAAVSNRISLPYGDGFDAPEQLDAFLNAVRWGAVSQADTRALQAPFRSGIQIEEHQLDPLARAIQMPRVNLLVADDVGLGKTIEAGLVAQEMIVRNRVRTILIVCPAGLQIHWRDQMRDKFGLTFRIVDRDLMKHLRRSRGIHVNPWAHFPRLITSIDFIKRDRPMRLMRELLPSEGESRYPRRFDLLIVDEAHNVAPSGSGHYSVDSMRTAAIRTLSPHFENKLFLSATPHNGYQASFTALLELLDDQRFARDIQPDQQQLQAIMVRRLKSDIRRWDDAPKFKLREVMSLPVDYTEEEKAIHAKLREYAQSRRTQSDEAFGGTMANEFVLKMLKKRLFSSPAAFRITLEKHRETIRRQVSGEDEPSAKRKRQPSVGILRRQIQQVDDEEYADDAEYEETTQSAVETASRSVQPLTQREEELLDEMLDWAERASGQLDSKTMRLLDWLEDTLLTEDGEWHNERVLIFTEYRATQKWLQGILATKRFNEAGRVEAIFGGMDEDKREAIKAAFQTDPTQSDVRILLATDAASEGIDLQLYCNRLIHMEIPWNPNRLEQRNGRIDRYGQTKTPYVYHFVAASYQDDDSTEHASRAASELEADLEFLMRAAQKVEQIREDLGKVGPVIADQVEEAMLGKRKQLDTFAAEEDSKALQRMLKFERDLRRQIDDYRQQLHQTKEDLNLQPDEIREAVEVALELAKQPDLIPGDEAGTYWLPALSGSWAACTEGILHPHTSEDRPITFDIRQMKDEEGRPRDDIVLAHLNHRLVQMALHLLRAEVWAPDQMRRLYRMTYKVLPRFMLKAPAVVGYGRLVIVGGDNQRLHEEIITAGGVLDPVFDRMNVGQTQDVLDKGQIGRVSGEMQMSLLENYPSIERNLRLALEARMRDRMNGMLTLLEERKQKELVDIEAVLMELYHRIEEELDGEPQYEQLDFWSNSERDQLRRNRDALHRRLEEIPGEIEKEKELIEARFADPTPRLFPVAVTYFVPEDIAQ
jgi:superfamily II DNA or RNA helicase